MATVFVAVSSVSLGQCKTVPNETMGMDTHIFPQCTATLQDPEVLVPFTPFAWRSF